MRYLACQNAVDDISRPTYGQKSDGAIFSDPDSDRWGSLIVGGQSAPIGKAGSL